MDSDVESSLSSGGEVYDATDSSDEASEPNESTFDLTLSAIHSYLGQDLSELRGRTILDDGIYVNLPFVVKESVVLFPGQTFPLTVFGRQPIDMMRSCIQKDRTFGVVCLSDGKMESVGTTAEIYEYTDGEPMEGFRLKAKGRQRFEILQIVQGYDTRIANVKILPEVNLAPPFFDERLSSLNSIRPYGRNEEDLKKLDRIENTDAVVTPWPGWVHRQYDPHRLSLKIRHHLRFLVDRGGNVPEEPTELSYWVAQNLLLDNNERLVLLNYDCAISRLQREIKYLMEDKDFVCCKCDCFITKQSYMFPMSKEGTQGVYCNASGTVFETITVYQAECLRLSGVRTTNYSWFPGYAWRIVACMVCRTHMGWKFTAVKDHLRPKMFWGLARKSLKHRD